ncbi:MULTISPECIES: hypothetical protein [Robiginitalea]|uniref:DNA primase n=1 Tax=Robiginitalea biformata (strain ATCC BAA-864 / DSM 15991 / KCTC 12146 / HTCC2501) TaxID=313596 RepID=A4CLF1_ROBBH|nr:MULTISPECIES: hypothetical protein [Robiginitalea]EAR15700.1 hypothetical protein RB2501_15269 [Robiginitalea biformata HTCC2501]MDC6354129.1 hypothetical protein [Robiginitalea sp. PM2]MDC6374396.1 hypothetical protein [Robiginitalea sp. SP8]
MKRIIIDYRKLTQELAAALLQHYPQGYGDEDLLTFKNARGEWIEAVELPTPEALYLVKIGQDLNRLMSDFLELDEDRDSDVPGLENEYDGSLETDLQLEED